MYVLLFNVKEHFLKKLSYIMMFARGRMSACDTRIGLRCVRYISIITVHSREKR